MSEKSIEYRDDCEDALCQAVGYSPEVLPELALAVTLEDFRDPFLGTFFTTATLLQEAGDLSRGRLRSELRSRGFLKDPAEMGAFIKLMEGVVSAGSAHFYANELARIAATDRLRLLLARASQQVEADKVDVEAVTGFLSSSLESILTRQTGLWSEVAVVAEKVVRDHELALEDPARSRTGAATGYPNIDMLTGGYFPGQLWQLAARSYMGKSTVALALSVQQAERGRGVYFASYEMSEDELMERMYADKSGVLYERFTQGTLSRDDVVKVREAKQHFDSLTMKIDDRPPETVAGLQARVKLASQSDTPIHFVVVDHLLLFPHRDRSTQRHAQLVEITRDLKRMAKECECTVLLLNQLNADADNAAPTDRHFSESKGVLANMDVNIMLHRETKSSEDMEFRFTKNRKGAPGLVNMKFYGEVQRLEEPGVEDMSNYDPCLSYVEMPNS